MLAEPERFPTRVRRLLASTKNDLQLSVASIWEISIKNSTGRLELPGRPETLVPEWLVRSRVTTLPIAENHALAVAGLPFHHRDPFDRMLIAQSRAEGLPIVTHDAAFDAYEVKVIRA
jgi:PIN domain nuclease of toxin-antitoxin system